MSSVQLSEACLSVPPVQTSYQPKGSYEDIAGIRSYVVGDKSAKAVLINIYDIFGCVYFIWFLVVMLLCSFSLPCQAFGRKSILRVVVRTKRPLH
jgi:hypothetical protein